MLRWGLRLDNQIPDKCVSEIQFLRPDTNQRKGILGVQLQQTTFDKTIYYISINGSR